MGSNQKLFVPGILACAALLTPNAGAVRGDEIRWLTDYPTALREAAEKNRPVLLDVFKVPCPPCQYLDNVVYRDPAVVKFINEHYVALKINGEENDVRIRDNQKILSFPTLVYLTPGQQILEFREGSLDPTAFLELSKKALTGMVVQTPKKNPTPFLGQVRTGPGAAPINVWASNRAFPPTSAAFSLQPLTPREERAQRAREILGQAVDAYRKQQWLTCLDQSRSLMVFYPDLAESTEARQLEQAIGTEQLERLEKDLIENLAQVYWELAQGKIRQNQLSQASPYMEKIVHTCPGSRYAPAAQEFLRSHANRPAGESSVTRFRP